jgi:hypothetical protein
VSHVHATDNTYYFTSHSYPWSQSMDMLDQVDSIENQVEAEQLKYVYIKSFLFLFCSFKMHFKCNLNVSRYFVRVGTVCCKM